MLARGLHKVLTGRLKKLSPPSLRYSSGDRGPSARIKSFDAKQYARSRSPIGARGRESACRSVDLSPAISTPRLRSPIGAKGREYPGFSSAGSSAGMLPLFATDTHGNSFGSGNGRRLVDSIESTIDYGQNENQKHWLGGQGMDLFSRRGNGQ